MHAENPNPAPPAGSIYFDDACTFCRGWVRRTGWIARRSGFDLVPLQSAAACRDLGLTAGDLPSEMKLRLADGRLLGGVDVLIAVAQAAWWTAPFAWLLRTPGLNGLARRAYRWIAAHRACLGGRCASRRHAAFFELP